MYQVEVAPFVPFDRGAPRLHTPAVYGGSPDKPFLYALPTAGERPLRFAIEGTLPPGLALDAETGILSGVPTRGDYRVTVVAGNRLGASRKALKLEIKPDGAGRNPLLGWCSWNAYGGFVTQKHIERAAELLVSTGLSSYGYQHVNLDSSWQGNYGGKYDAITANAKFPDMRAMTDFIHARGGASA